jgi:HEAT repeat protein
VRTIRTLAARGGDAAAESVASVARHEDTATASEAIVALGRMASDRAVAVLTEVATKEKRTALRQLAVTALTQHETVKSAETFRQVVRSDSAPEVRAAAAMGLASQGVMDDVPLLVEAAGVETDLVATRSEVTALGTLLGVSFPYDSNAPPEVRQESLARTRDAADHLYKVRKGLLPQDMKCLSDLGGGR